MAKGDHMEFAKPSQAVVALFEAVAPGPPVAERRKMFGMPCSFANNGQMFFGVYGDALMLRLSEADRAELLTMPGAALFEPQPGRVMKEYVAVPPALQGDRDQLQRWIARSLAYAESLPAKEKKGKPAAPKKAAKKIAKKTTAKKK
jgi:TfoX/Sxy family transcriptional regulator of competence genes